MNTGTRIATGTRFTLGLVVPVLVCLGLMGVLIYPVLTAAGYFG